MLLNEVRKLGKFEIYLYWIKERESIRMKKIMNEPKPWTDDEILASYRFCNVRRMDDKVSQWLFHNVYQPYFDHEFMLLNVVVSRLLNNPDSLSQIGFIESSEDIQGALRKLIEYRDAGNKIFNGAYIVSTNGLEGDKLKILFERIVSVVAASPLCRGELDTHSIERAVEQMTSFWGISTFMAGQIIADMRWATMAEYEDRLKFAVIGPGSRRGMNRLLNLPLENNMKQKEFTMHLGKVMSDCIRKLPYSIVERLEAIDYQNCFCEYDKYLRTLLDGRRPKQLYQGT